MDRSHSSSNARTRTFWCLGLACLAVTGCGQREKGESSSVSKPPVVGSGRPEARTIVRGVDIGDEVKQGGVLATRMVFEIVEDVETKRATVKPDGDRVGLARERVEVSETNVKSVPSNLVESKAILSKLAAEVERWDMEVERLTREIELDRGRGGLGVELSHTRDLHERPLEAGLHLDRVGDRGHERPAPAAFDDRLHHDRRRGADDPREEEPTSVPETSGSNGDPR